MKLQSLLRERLFKNVCAEFGNEHFHAQDALNTYKNSITGHFKDYDLIIMLIVLQLLANFPN